jgi:multidrug efflux pump subunit AcrB
VRRAALETRLSAGGRTIDRVVVAPSEARAKRVRADKGTAVFAPLAAIGVVLVLFYTGTTFNVQSFIGCIMLGGIVVNNAILLVDHTNLLRRRDGMPIREAIEEAGRRRLRPILMTALTTIIGLVPLALGSGEGGEAQAPMARVVIGGLLSSTLITLVFVPVVYSLFERRAYGAVSGAQSDAGNT